jgi:hypothetical protein
MCQEGTHWQLLPGAAMLHEVKLNQLDNRGVILQDGQ